MQINLFKPETDGWHIGRLFEPRNRRPTKRELIKTGFARRAAECRNTPKWADKAAIRAVYNEQRRLAKLDGARVWAVDHIIPLNNPLVCGLHVANNLQIIPYKENAAKSNRHRPDMPEYQMILEFHYG